MFVSVGLFLFVAMSLVNPEITGLQTANVQKTYSLTVYGQTNSEVNLEKPMILSSVAGSTCYSNSKTGRYYRSAVTGYSRNPDGTFKQEFREEYPPSPGWWGGKGKRCQGFSLTSASKTPVSKLVLSGVNVKSNPAYHITVTASFEEPVVIPQAAPVPVPAAPVTPPAPEPAPVPQPTAPVPVAPTTPAPAPETATQPAPTLQPAAPTPSQNLPSTTTEPTTTPVTPTPAPTPEPAAPATPVAPAPVPTTPAAPAPADTQNAQQAAPVAPTIPTTPTTTQTPIPVPEPVVTVPTPAPQPVVTACNLITHAGTLCLTPNKKDGLCKEGFEIFGMYPNQKTTRVVKCIQTYGNLDNCGAYKVECKTGGGSGRCAFVNPQASDYRLRCVIETGRCDDPTKVIVEDSNTKEMSCVSRTEVDWSQILKCTENDGGINLGTGGKTSGQFVTYYGTTAMSTRKDQCFVRTTFDNTYKRYNYAVVGKNGCSGSNCYLLEFSCKKDAAQINKDKATLQGDYIQCTKGCKWNSQGDTCAG